MTISIQRLPAVKSRTGLARSTIYKYIQQGCFPRPIQLGKKAVGWKSNDIDEWIESRIHTSPKKGA
ncbi:helix-turn-helix transcriptional regulator [Cycloclasticus pugetii]|uniref:helix-turn-helix transcriptional regulator n=1 Tax=Cycloclasticus pugetii TaxID=34068 RepID=UPI000915DC54|nr:AlpA family transcriptional regulator [Cycloclasticus pugetii]SHJ32445.1 transcriptional regulator, AlpA family [Cycloclasticus pugetii]